MAWANDRLLEKYPDLKNVPVERRAWAIYNKILTDQSAMIPVGIWVGALITVVFCTSFAFVQIPIAGRYVRKRQSIKGAVLPYLDVAIPATFVLALVNMVLVVKPLLGGGLPGPVWIHPVLLLLWSLPVLTYRQDWRWFLRILMHIPWLAVVAVFLIFLT